MSSVEQLLNSGIAALKSNNPGAAVVSAKQLAQRTSVSEDPEVVEIGNQLSAVADLVAAKVGPPKPLNVAVPFSPANPPPGPNLATLKKDVTDILSIGVSALPQEPKNEVRLKEWRQLQTLYEEAKAAEAATAPKTVTDGRSSSMNTAFVSAYRAYMDAKGKYLTKYAGVPNVGPGAVDELNPFTEEGKAAIAMNEAEQTALAARRKQAAARQLNTANLTSTLQKVADQQEEDRLAAVLRDQEAERRKPFEERERLEAEAKSVGFNSIEQAKTEKERLRQINAYINETPNPNWAALNAPLVKMARKVRGTPLEERYNELKEYVLQKQISQRSKQTTRASPSPPAPTVPGSTGLNKLRQALQKPGRAPILAAATQKAKGRLFNVAEQARATQRRANIRQGTEIRQSAPAFPIRAGANFAKNAANLAALTQRQPVVTEGEGRAPAPIVPNIPIVQQQPTPTRSRLNRMRNAIASASASAPANTNTLVRPTNQPVAANTNALFGAPRPAYSPTGLTNTGNTNIFQREREPNMNQRPLGSTAPSQPSLWVTQNRNTGVGALSPSTGRALSSYLSKKRGGTRRKYRRGKQTRKLF
jgi:hypothetical protein